MSRNPRGRPPGWRVGECLWSPQLKDDNSRWGFWETMLAVKRGDVVFHLCGDSGASFTGFSVADEDGQPIDQGPLGPRKLYRVALRDYTEFEEPMLWDTIRISKHNELLEYFTANRNRKGKSKERLFYVLQGGRLQCLNGAYLSFLSDALIETLFEFQVKTTPSEVVVESSAAVGTKLRTAAARVGQQKFSQNVKSNFSDQCCFPSCPVSDPKFLVGAHIARWADESELRGRTENGLCFCVFHDRAFEIGTFTFDRRLRVKLHKCDLKLEWVQRWLSAGVGELIKPSKIAPTEAVLRHHWKRHGIGLT
jgi:putative restriction endonuclease